MAQPRALEKHAIQSWERNISVLQETEQSERPLLTSQVVWDIMVLGGLDPERNESRLAKVIEKGRSAQSLSTVPTLMRENLRQRNQIEALQKELTRIRRELEVMTVERPATKHALIVYALFGLGFSTLFIATVTTFVLWRVGALVLPVSPISLALLSACLFGWSATCIAGFRSKMRKLS